MPHMRDKDKQNEVGGGDGLLQMPLRAVTMRQRSEMDTTAFVIARDRTFMPGAAECSVHVLSGWLRFLREREEQQQWKL